MAIGRQGMDSRHDRERRMKPFVYIFRMSDGNMTGTVEAENQRDALIKAMTLCADTWKLPLIEAIIVEPSLPIERPMAPTAPKQIISVYGMAAALRTYRATLERAQDGRDIEIARGELADWFERYTIGVDFTGEKENA